MGKQNNMTGADACRANGCKWQGRECEECGALFIRCEECGAVQIQDGDGCEECDPPADIQTPGQRAALVDSLARGAAADNIAKMPERAYMVNGGQFYQTAARVVHFRRGEYGFYTDTVRLMDPEEYVRAQNAFYKAHAGHAAAMHAASLFGYSVPAANPDLYREDGTMHE